MNESKRITAVAPNPSFFAQLKTFFITGLFVSIPLGVTLMFLFWIDGYLRSFWPKPYNEKFYVSIVSLAILLFLILMLGVLSKNFFGRHLLQLGDSLLNSIPIVRWIYSTVKQVTEAFSSGKSMFKEVVLIRYPHERSWSLAFLTADTPESFESPTGEDLVSVLMPTTPNPTSGFLIFVPKADVIRTKLSVDQAFRLIISAGTIHNESEEGNGNG